MKTTAVGLAVMAIFATILAGCARETGTVTSIISSDYDRPLPPGSDALHKLHPDDVPDFGAACENLPDLRQAVGRSLNFLAKPSSRRFYPRSGITHSQAVAGLEKIAALLDASPSPEDLHQAIRREFDVYTSVGWNNGGTVLFTGYYTPIFDASEVRTSRFRYPIYRAPADLVKRDDGTVLGIRKPDGQVEPLPDRRELESSDMLAGTELYWLSDPFEVYIAHVQGSAKLRIGDDKLVTVGYAASNGHEYAGIAAEMIADGKIAGDSLSLQAMIDYFRANPDDVLEYTRRNPRFVFFVARSGEPAGSINEPVTAWRTIATDKDIFPPGCLTFISVDLPQRSGGAIQPLPVRSFMLDQDTGGAIRAPGRCDVYMGLGDEAAALAGRAYHQGRLYYLVGKP